MNCKNCIHWDKCSKTNGKTRYYGETIASDNVEELCEWFISTADVVPKSEVDRLTVELEAMRTAANSYKMHYENLAREIFEEIGKILFKHTNIAIAQKSVTCELAIDYIGEDIAELKKKYTEGEQRND